MYMSPVSQTHPAMQPVLTHHTLNHLVLHLETKPANKRETHIQWSPELTWGQVRGGDVSPGRQGRDKVDCRCSKLQRSCDCIYLEC